MKQLLGLVAFASMLATVAVPAAAASPGVAYDSVTKFAIGEGAASAQPGTFDADFQTASQPVQQQPGRTGGLFGGLNAAMAQVAAAGSMMKSGLAERHFIAGARQRVDNVAAQTATILDCQARTLTTLDLKAKTYKVVSLDQPQPVAPRSAGPPAPQAVATDDGSKVAMNVTNEALGQKQIGSDLADGFRSNITMTITRPNSQTVTTQMTTTEYVINFPDATLTCGSVASGPAGPSAAALQQYATMQRAMGENNSRFTVTNTGPTPPHGRFSLFTVLTMGGSGATPGATGVPPGGSPPGGFASIIERGHERAIQSDDPIFSVPPDFTKTN